MSSYLVCKFEYGQIKICVIDWSNLSVCVMHSVHAVKYAVCFHLIMALWNHTTATAKWNNWYMILAYFFVLPELHSKCKHHLMD